MAPRFARHHSLSAWNTIYEASGEYNAGLAFGTVKSGTDLRYSKASGRRDEIARKE